GKPISVLEQRGAYLWGEHGGIRTSESKDDNIWTFQVLLIPEAIDFLREHNVFLTNPIGEGSGDTKDNAKSIAYKKALDYVNKQGFTREWALKNRESNIFDKFDPDIIKEVKKRAK